MKKSIIFKDKNNEKKYIEIGEPFIPDGSIWFTIRIAGEALPSIKLDKESINKLNKFLKKYSNN